ncbi:MAG TPA: hypothetical protein VHJ58_15950 [Vicinamibacterales bacterium]|jgi:hypothetical protein|nr:hypothetical protein [Vicinamibacterales bacterium]
MRIPAPGACGLSLPLTIALLGTATSALAQTGIPPKGVGSVTIAFQVIDNSGHRTTDGFLVPDFKSTDAGLYVEGEYSFTDRLSLSAGIPYIFAKYRGPSPNPAHPPLDSCRCWHSGWQDVGASVRYNVIGGQFFLTPSVSLNAPSRAYDYRGESAVGRRLNELRFAVDAGRRLDEISPRLSLQARYAYAVVQKVLDIPNNRSNLSVETAFAFTRSLSARGFVSWQHTHGGLRLGSLPPSDLEFPGDANTPELFEQHDRLLRDNNWRIGGGMAYSFPNVDVFATWVEYVAGTDTHAGRAFTLGLSWPFELGSAHPSQRPIR